VVLIAPALLVLAVFAFYPVAGSLWLSLHRVVLSLPALGEPFVGLANFSDLLASPVFWHSLVVTVVFVATTTLLEVVIGLGLALCLDAAFRGRGLVRAAALVPWAVPTVVSSQMWRYLFNDAYGPVSYYLLGGAAPLADRFGALAAVITADVWKTSAFAALIILAGLQTIPREVEEAAEVDGASPLCRFILVTLPLLKPALLAALLFRTIDAFRAFDVVFVMTQGGPGDATDLLQYLGYKRMFAEGMMGSGAAVSTIVFLFTFIVSLAYVRLVGSALWRGTGRA
jgi:multiple sugar transport system permease protein